MICPECARENRSDARFCDGCGAVLSPRCGHCNRELRPAARFCDGCGRATSAATDSEPATSEARGTPRSYTPPHLVDRILHQKAGLEGERKHVTVVFADVANYTELSERTDPETMHELMDRCFQRILDAVHRYEGTVNQFTGDGVMALFGAPLALEDAPRRAVLAALAVQRAIQPLDDEVQARHGARFRMRVGIHSGPVVVGRIGDDLRMDYTAVGDTTNLAARLQEHAAPGAAWISEATRQLIAGFFQLKDVGSLAVKGKREPVRAFEVLAERSVSGRIEAAVPTGLTPLVGRERELQALWAAFESARDQHGQVVFVVGEAGIGKSRLLFEFRRQLGAEPHTWFEGHCSAYAATNAFHAVSDGLRRSFAIEDRDEEAAALAKLEQREAKLGGELAWTLPFVRQLLALPVGDPAVEAMGPVQRRSEIFRALRARFLRAAERAPLVFVVEDLHWMDAASEELLGFLAEATPAARVLLIATYRPGYRHSFGDRSYHVRIAPQALSSRSMASMAGSVVGSAALPPNLLELIAAKAEGNPFFVEEVTKSLLEEGVLARRDGRVELQRPLAEVSVPDSIQDVIMARLDRLREEPRRAIQVASVIGREFALRLLEQIREAGDRVDELVEQLRALELIYEKGAHPELAYMFKHALTHDVAYQSLLVAHRKELHRVVGEAIEALYTDRLPEHYTALAHHFERGEVWERALDYHERAARHAAERFANRSVIEHCRHGLAIAERLGESVPPEKRAALEVRMGEAYSCVSEFLPAAEAYLRAAEYSPDPASGAWGFAQAAFAVVFAHEYRRGEELIDRAIARARSCSDPAAEAIALIGRDLMHSSRYGPKSERDQSEAVAAAERSGNPVALGFTLAMRALHLQQVGNYRESLDLSERALSMTQRVPNQSSLALVTIAARWNRAIALTCLGQYGPALAMLRDGLELSDRIGDRAMKARMLNTVGWLFAELGCHRRARTYNEQSEALAAEIVRLGLVAAAPEVHANAAINLANDCTALGDPEGALAHLDPIRAALDSRDPWMKWRYGLHLANAEARVALAHNDPERALELVATEVTGAREHNAPKLEARALELRARVLLRIDDRDAADATLHDALHVAEEIAYPPVTWRATALLGEIARRRGDRGEAERRATAVRRRFATLARSLAGADLAAEFVAMGDRLVADPLGAYR